MAPMHRSTESGARGRGAVDVDRVGAAGRPSGHRCVKAGTRQPAKAAAQRAAREIRSLINGVAIDSDQTPLPNATIRLRNLEANEIEQVVTANALGEFSFVARPDVAVRGRDRRSGWPHRRGWRCDYGQRG